VDVQPVRQSVGTHRKQTVATGIFDHRRSMIPRGPLISIAVLLVTPGKLGKMAPVELDIDGVIFIIS
jgi:hypothetical protein